jgi:hypothetical protein
MPSALILLETTIQYRLISEPGEEYGKVESRHGACKSDDRGRLG